MRKEMIQIFISAVLLGCNTRKFKDRVNLCYFLYGEKNRDAKENYTS